MKRLITRNEAAALLSPHLSTIQRCIRDAWDEWRLLNDHQLARGNELSATARARIIYDNAANRARAAFADVSGVDVLRKHGFLVLLFGGEVAVRFKKLRTSLSPSGIRTRQHECFAMQEEIPGIPGPATFVIAGYVLDQAQVKIDRLVLTCADGLGLRWVLDLEVQEEGEVVPIGATAPPPVPPQVRSTQKGITENERNR